MEELTLAVPGMWADHHVLAVRELLRQDDAVTSTTASARDGVVSVEYDAARTDPQRLTALLTEGGYACGEPEAAADPPTDKPAWLTAGVRVTTTNAVDLAMSGDHRQY
ncbi:MAG: heavy-metal-associated domain-containing protein [Actinomycetes bacterium]